MGFKKREYNFYKKLSEHAIRNVPNCAIYGCKQIFPPTVLLDMLPEFIEEENFEACKAISDTIREWCTKHNIEIPADATLIIPPKRETVIHGHVSLGDPNDPYGLASGGSINF